MDCRANGICGGKPAEDPWIPRLLDEYKMLQDKIDKIGAFRFTIKGWSVTIAAGAIAAATAANASAWIALLPAPVAFAFFIMEWRQHELSTIYGERAVQIENVMVGLRSGRLKDLSSIRFVPGISASVWNSRQRRRQVLPWRRVRRDPDYLIYLFQILVTLAVAGFLFTRASAPQADPAGSITYGPSSSSVTQASPTTSTSGSIAEGSRQGAGRTSPSDSRRRKGTGKVQ